MNEAELDTNTGSDVLSLGQTLAKARHDKGVGFEEITARLKLSESQINKLEQDDYHKLGPETFVKGYIKSYCGLLGLDAQETLRLYQSPVVPEQKGKMKSFSRRTEKEAHDNRLMWFSYAVLALVIGSSAIWFWQTISTQNEITPGDARDIPQVSAPVTGVPNEVPNEMEQENTPAENTIDSGELNTTTEPAVQSDDVSEARPQLVSATSESEATQVSTEVPQNTVATELSSPAVTAPAPEPGNTQSEFSQSTIVMVFKEDSWVEIFDASQERVAFGVKKAGYTMTVSGVAPFSVVLGKHRAVSITLDGEAVDISGLPRNRLAKFNLPLAE
ncbi:MULTISPECIES: RodZ family helix-turn-helix domain-containing protein [unclassified Pseudoalteromonas]|uniref:RodZ domain-containing protein n=1 Tax=unclassified Pseudoalteromonas TaxID=194690 RepID=UPI002097D0F7|nr:RodZ family helix-turn-helix domain-containing protein [Pseudoalteromonas sp. XMcav2-N]MCO7189256.1 helix-turn-helix domain-containing protein [Pseudoalteromonas sp. XMcav2-N]